MELLLTVSVNCSLVLKGRNLGKKMDRITPYFTRRQIDVHDGSKCDKDVYFIYFSYLYL